MAMGIEYKRVEKKERKARSISLVKLLSLKIEPGRLTNGLTNGRTHTSKFDE